MQHVELHEGVTLSGSIKNRPEDFVVDEIPLYEPCGEGEHLYIGVRKNNVSHDEMIRLVARTFGVTRRAVGVAGRKDLYAMTTQVVSIHLPTIEPDTPLYTGNIEITRAARHTNKLRLGHLTGNRFAIRIRECDVMQLPVIQDRLQLLATNGLPNAFGPQRFGNLQSNHVYGLAIVLEDWDRLVDHLLQGDEPHHTHVKNGMFQKALDAWPFGQPAERAVLGALAKNLTSRQACKRISKPLRKLWVNALQSKVFNMGLANRVANGTWNTLVAGDLVWNHQAGGRTFIAIQEEIDSTDLQSRVASIAISPSGPLWGTKMRMPEGEVLQHEREVLHAFGLDETKLQAMRTHATGARRPLCVPVENATACAGEDEHGVYIQVQFELPAGSYATVLIDELLNVSV